MRRATLVPGMLGALLATLQASPVHAEGEVPSRRLDVQWKDHVPHLSFSARDVITKGLRKKLRSGLPQTLLLKVLAYRKGREKPIAAHVRACRITYDLWKQIYRIETSTREHAIAARDMSDVLKHCAVVRDVKVGGKGDFQDRSEETIYFGVLVEFNPMSTKTVQKIRRWLARPSGGGLQGDAFLGSFVSLFVNRDIGQAEHSVRFRSQALEVP